MRISDWSSDVCSSDLSPPEGGLFLTLLSNKGKGHVRKRLGAGCGYPWVRMSPAAGLWPTHPPLFRTQGYPHPAFQLARSPTSARKLRITAVNPRTREPSHFRPLKHKSTAPHVHGEDNQ